MLYYIKLEIILIWRLDAEGGCLIKSNNRYSLLKYSEKLTNRVAVLD